MEYAAKKTPASVFIYIAVIVSVFVLILVPFLRKKNRENVTYSKALMGTIVEITIAGGDAKTSEGASVAAVEEIKRLEGIFSSYKKDSEVSRVSANAGAAPVKVSPEVMEVVEAALRVSKLSGGAFDPTVGSLARVWGFSGEVELAPDKKDVKKILPLVNYRLITIDAKASAVGLKKKGMVLNLGGIAKGYIVGKAIEALKRNNVRRGIIKAGGDMTVFDVAADEKKAPFIVGIQDPRDSKKLIGEVHIANGAVATSGDYERFFEKDGMRFHHILDPGSGYPAMKSRSVTVITSDPTLADGLSTAVFVMGPEKGMELIERLDGVEAVIVDKDGRVLTSKGFKGRIFD
ncbi:MAG: FAD:protein FMN transferase [Deltaproteobacteria bacterium]|nr:FAD:protein FMN transferase [Deltaproteobacteria bacterium]